MQHAKAYNLIIWNRKYTIMQIRLSQKKYDSKKYNKSVDIKIGILVNTKPFRKGN